MSNLVLVIGSNNLLQIPVVRHLLDEDYMVRILTRSPQSVVKRFGGGCEAVNGEVTNLASLHSALQDCQAVYVNLSGERHPGVEVQGVQNILQVAAGLPIQRLVYHSSTSVSARNCWFPPVAARYLVEQSIRASSIPYTIFRTGYTMEILKPLVTRNWAMQVGLQPFPFHWIAGADYARMLSLSLTTPSAANKTFHLRGPAYCRMKDALHIVSSILHPRSRWVYLPFWFAGLLAALRPQSGLRSCMPYLWFHTKMPEDGDPGEANTLLGVPQVTLEGWCKSFQSELAAQ